MSSLILPPRFDGALVNAVGSAINQKTGMGTARDKSSHWEPGIFYPLPQEYRGSCHATCFEVKRVCEVFPKEMTRAGWHCEIADGDGKEAGKADEYIKRLGAQNAFKKAEFYRRLHDGAAIVLLIDDGQTPDNPVDEARIKTIHPIRKKDVLHRWQVNVSDISEDPEFYQVYSSSNILNGKGEQIDYKYGNWSGWVHKTRVLRFDDGMCDSLIRQRNNGWSPGSLLQFLKPLQDYLAGFGALGAMMADASLFTYGITGLMEIIAGGNETLVKNRLAENWLATSVYGAIVHDSEKEKVGFTERNLSGWDSSLVKLEQRLLAASGLPHSYLLGRTGPNGGLDSGGDAEKRLMADLANQEQESNFREHLEYLYRLTFLAKDGPTKGKEADFTVGFNSLYQQSDMEKSELESVVIQKDVQAISAGIYTPEDALRSHYSSPEFNPTITIDWEKKDKELEEAKQQAQQQAGLEAQGLEGGAPADGGDEFAFDEFQGDLQQDSLEHLDAIPEKYRHIDFVPPLSVRKAAKNGLEMRRKYGKGGLSIQDASKLGIGSGVARARDLSGGGAVSPETIAQMNAYFARHASDKKAKGFKPGADGYPSIGRIAWELRGGDAGAAWAGKVKLQMAAADAKEKRGDSEAREDSIGVRFDGVEWKFDAPKKTTLKVGDTKMKNGVTYVLNENRRWTKAKTNQESEPAAKKKGQEAAKAEKAKLKPEATQKAKQVSESAKKKGKDKPLDDLDPESRAIVEKMRRVMRGEEEAPAEKPAPQMSKQPTPKQSKSSTGQQAIVKSKDLDEVKDLLEKEFGKELVSKAESNVQRLIDEGDMFIRASGDTVDRIISGGRFKSSFEAGGKGRDYNKRRAQTENQVFGLDEKTDKTQRPIYGYLGGKDFDDKDPTQTGPGHYGNVAIRMKSDAKQRASITDNDSWASSVASPASQFNAASLSGTTEKRYLGSDFVKEKAKNQLEVASKAKSPSELITSMGTPYMEMHLHGGASASEIAELIYTKGDRPTKKVQDWAKKNGVQITIHS